MSDFEPFETLSGNRDKGMVILADHAMRLLPERYGLLGLPETAFSRHIAYDIGIEALCRALAQRLDVPAVLSRFSRLLIDPNRGEDDPTLIMKISDGAIIPGNHPITDEEWNYRIETFHRPYHRAVDETITAVAEATGKAPLVLSLHSFTPAWKGVARPWHAGILWDSDDRAVRPLLAKLGADGDLVVGDNEPYDGALRGDTMYRHCMVRGIPHALLEVRQDLIADEAGVAAWAERLTPMFAELNADPALHAYSVHPSRTGAYEGSWSGMTARRLRVSQDARLDV
jgi:predicted N-formylglutamate amidohydrolase